MFILFPSPWWQSTKTGTMLNWVIHLCYLLCLPEQLGLGSVYYIPPPFYKVMLLCISNFLGWSDVHTVHLDSLSHIITGCYEVKHPLSTEPNRKARSFSNGERRGRASHHSWTVDTWAVISLIWVWKSFIQHCVFHKSFKKSLGMLVYQTQW